MTDKKDANYPFGMGRRWKLVFPYIYNVFWEKYYGIASF